MNLRSKDAPLEDSIAKMQAILETFSYNVTFAKEKHPLPYCFSINLASQEAPFHIYSNGKGSLSASSRASALGEYIERLQTNNFFSDFHLPGRAYYPDEAVFDFGGDFLSSTLKALYNPDGELGDEDWVDFNSDFEDKIVALPFVESSTQKRVFFPVNILNNLYVSNGLASGNTPYEAKVQALSEVYERYVKFEILKNGYALPCFPDELIHSFTKLSSDLKTLQDAGFIVSVHDASLGGKFPVTAISLINPKNASLFLSFGAHPILEVSLERTMSELMQGRLMDNLDAFETPTFDDDIVKDNFNLEAHFIDSNGKISFSFLNTRKSFAYTPWVYESLGSEHEYHYLTYIAQTLKKEIYIREYTYLGFYSCQLIVPGLSEVYPLEDMIYQNRNAGKFIRPLVLNFTSQKPNALLEATDALEDSLNMEKYIGVIFKTNFTMLEFKIQSHLLLGNDEDALLLLGDSEHFLAKLLSELLRLKLQKRKWCEYEQGFNALFGASNVALARSIIAKKAYFIDVSLHPHYENMLAMYDNLATQKALMLR